MDEARPAIVGVMIMFSVIGVAIAVRVIDMLQIARSGGLDLDMFCLSHRRDQERARDKRSGHEPEGG